QRPGERPATRALAPRRARPHLLQRYGGLALRKLGAGRCDDPLQDVHDGASSFVRATKRANAADAAPESIASCARATPAASESAPPPAYTAAPAFSTATSRAAPVSPARIRRVVSAFCCGSPPGTSSGAAVPSPTYCGTIR